MLGTSSLPGPARGDITVTDPLTVSVAFGRPATCPSPAVGGRGRAAQPLAGRLTAASAVNSRKVSDSCRYSSTWVAVCDR